MHCCASLSSQVVTTAKGLQLAIILQHPRIEIKEHLDLGGLSYRMANLLKCTTDFTIWVRFLTISSLHNCDYARKLTSA